MNGSPPATVTCPSNPHPEALSTTARNISSGISIPAWGEHSNMQWVHLCWQRVVNIIMHPNLILFFMLCSCPEEADQTWTPLVTGTFRQCVVVVLLWVRPALPEEWELWPPLTIIPSCSWALSFSDTRFKTSFLDSSSSRRASGSMCLSILILLLVEKMYKCFGKIHNFLKGLPLGQYRCNCADRL